MDKIRLKNKEEIEILREGGKRHAEILKILQKKVIPGVSTLDLENLARELIAEYGDKGAFLNYKPDSAKRPYPAVLCVSINDTIVHGIPNEKPKIIKDTDIVSIDLGLSHKGLITDSAFSIAMPKADKVGKKLVADCRKALAVGIKAVKSGGHVGDIGFAIQRFTKTTGFSLAEGLSGHGVGIEVHEMPFVPNVGKRGEGERLVPGLVIAIEPMLNEGTGKIKSGGDGHSFKTHDGKRSAHFEHTVLVTEKGCEVLTE